MPLPQVPAVLALLLIVYVAGFVFWEWRRLRIAPEGYPWDEALLSLAIAVIRRLILLLGAGSIALLVLGFVHEFRLVDLTLSRDTPLRLLLLFVGVEFCYYWQHRCMHQCRWLWADHSVHHSPNRLVFLVAERLGWLTAFNGSILFFAPLCLLGYAPRAVVAMVSLNLLYQFWLHTEQIPRLPRFEWLFNSPSLHRVHHAANPAYLDANYGGILIVFDRLFGTYVAERKDEPVRIGLVTPQQAHNPVTVALAEWRAIAQDVFTHWRHPRRVLHYLFDVPGWSHDGSRRTSAMIKSAASAGNGIG